MNYRKDSNFFESLIRDSAYEPNIQIGELIDKAWEGIKPVIWIMVGYTVLFFALSLITSMNQYSNTIFSFFLSPIFLVGYFFALEKNTSREEFGFDTFFKGFERYGQFFMANLLIALFVGVGLILLIIPGIYLLISYQLVYPLMVHSKMDFWKAMETSRRLINQNFWRFFLLGLVVFLINVVGFVTILGILVTLPLTFSIYHQVYLNLIDSDELVSPEVESDMD